MSSDVTYWNGMEVHAHPGLTIKSDKSVSIDLSKYELRGDHVVITDDLQVIATYGDRISVSRGCSDLKAACWTGGTALGDMQYAGVGKSVGFWPYRNRFYSGNKVASIRYETGNVERIVKNIPAHYWVQELHGVDGREVVRY